MGLAVLFTAITLNYYVKVEHEKRFSLRSEVIATMLSHSAIASVAFMDRKRAQQELKVFRSLKDVRFACLYNSQLKEPLAVFNDHDVVKRKCNGFPAEDFTISNRHEISIHKVLTRNGVRVGSLYVVISSSELIDQRKNMVLVLIISSLISCALALSLTSKLSVSLYKPILVLDKTSKDIARKRDWSLRATKYSNDELGGLVDTFNSMIDIIERDQTELRRLAYYDPLTAIPNRRLLEHKIYTAIARSRRQKKNFAVIFIDLDDFKWVNDTLGHDQGDILLKSITERMSSCMRAEDTLARFGGDEFVILAELLNEQKEVEHICDRVLGALKEPIPLKEESYFAKVSLGVVYADSTSRDMFELLKKADIALYEAKKRGKNQYQIYSDESRVESAPSPTEQN